MLMGKGSSSYLFNTLIGRDYVAQKPEVFGNKRTL